MPTRDLRAARTIVRLATAFAPSPWRDRMRAEWDAELDAEQERGERGLTLVRAAMGVFADVRTVRALERRRVTHEESRMSEWTRTWVRETSVALRSLLRAPAYATVAVLTLGVGIGGAATLYTLLERVVLDPLAYPEPDRLIKVDNAVPGVGPDARFNASTAQYVYFSDHSETLESVGIYYLGGANLQTPSGPERIRSAWITPEILSLTGGEAERGRSLSLDDLLPGNSDAVVLSHAFWERAFGANPTIVGRTISIDDQPSLVVGVLANDVALPDEPPGYSVDVWRPMTIDRAAPFYNSHSYRMIGRLRAGADTASVEAELERLTQSFPEAFPIAYRPDFFERTGFRTETTDLKAAVLGDAAKPVWILFAGTALLLLVACANVANLFLVRMEARARELAIRGALGAGLERIARYLVIEGLVLAVSGAALALLIAYGAIRLLVNQPMSGLPRLDDVALGPDTVVFTALLALAIGIGLALHPLVLHRRTPSATLSDGSRSSGGPRAQRFRSALIVTQVATALVLATSAGLLLESLRKLTQIHPGVDPEGALTMQINLTSERYPDAVSLWGFYRDALERIRAIPGVSSAGMSQEIPLRAEGGFGCTIQAFEDPAVYEHLKDAGFVTCAAQESTTPGYFEAIGIPLLAGRTFADADLDDPTRATVVVSQAVADRFWPGEDPIGKRIGANGRNRGYHTVIGVVGDVAAERVQGEKAIAIYYPIVLNPASELTLWPGTMQLVIKTAFDDPTTVLPSVREAIGQVDPEVPLTKIQTLQDVIDTSIARPSFIARLLGIAAGTAMLLAAVGLYGVISYAVSRRRREIGTRLAIGARPREVQWMIVKQSLTLVAIGLVVGAAASVSGSRVLSGLLYGVSPTDPRALGAAASLLLLVALLASWVPATRAARLDPSETLREG